MNPYSFFWRVEIGGVQHTSRVRGMYITQEQRIADIGKLEARITLDNNDGAYTPRIGGTYSNVDWANQLIEITCSFDGVGYNTTVFFGMPYDFNLEDDGTSSTFTLFALDPFSAIGRATTETADIIPNQPAQPQDLAITNLLNNGTGSKTVTGVPAPVPAGASSAAWRIDDQTRSGRGIFQQYSYVDGYPSEIIRDRMLPTGMGVLIPREWDSVNEEWVGSLVMDDLVRNDATPTYITPTTLDVERVYTGHNLDQLVNRASLPNSFYTDTEAENTTSENLYGPRAIEFTDCVPIWNKGGTPSPSTFRIDPQPYCDEWVNRFGDYTYQAIRIDTRHSLQGAGKRENFEDLLSVQALWNFGYVKYTPTGSATELTDNICITRKEIRATPSDTLVSLYVLPARDFQTFVLNGAALGVLNENRLG